MPSVNTTLQQYSPLISYTPEGAWRPGSTSDDAYFSSYDDGFAVTAVSGATASFRFYGTGIWLFGAQRPNHGTYTVLLDGVPTTLNGAGPDQFQSVLFSATGLSRDAEHTITITNAGSGVDSPFLDLDFITYETAYGEDSDRVFQQVLDVSSKDWSYGSAWALERVDGARNGVLLGSSTPEAAASLSFNGEHIDIYGTVGTDCGSFYATIDGGPQSQPVSCYQTENHMDVLLYSADIAAGNHTLQVTNLQAQGNSKMALDYAVITVINPDMSVLAGTGASSPPTGPQLSVPQLIGIIVGGVGALAVCLGVCMWLRLRRRLRSIKPGRRKDLNLEANPNAENVWREPLMQVRRARPSTAPSLSSRSYTQYTTDRTPVSTVPTQTTPWSSTITPTPSIRRNQSQRQVNVSQSREHLIPGSLPRQRPLTAPEPVMLNPANMPPRIINPTPQHIPVAPPHRRSLPPVPPVPILFRSDVVQRPEFARRGSRREKERDIPSLASPPPDYYQATQIPIDSKQMVAMNNDPN